MAKAEKKSCESVGIRLASWAKHFAGSLAFVLRRPAWPLRPTTRIVLLALVTTAALGRGLGRSRVKGLNELVIQIRFVHGVPTIMAETNYGPLWVVIDTGAEASILDDGLCGKGQALCLRINNKNLCGIPLCASQVPQFTRLQSIEGPPKIKALIGNDILRKFDHVLIDYRNGSIRLIR